MTVDMFLKLDGLHRKSTGTKRINLLRRNKGVSRLTSLTIAKVHFPHPWQAEPGERLAGKRVTMFALEVAVGAAACAGAILAIFAWTGASL